MTEEGGPVPLKMPFLELPRLIVTFKSFLLLVSAAAVARELVGLEGWVSWSTSKPAHECHDLTPPHSLQ